MNQTPVDNISARRSPRVVELVGPAGAGKTTLLQALCQRDDKIRAGIHLRRIEQIPFLVGLTLLLLPAWLRDYRRSRWFTRQEMRAMIYLQAWHHILERQPTMPDVVTILDHGPIFRLVLLREFGPEIVKSHVFQQWWDRTRKQWAMTLDFVVWLDAPDSILLERIQTRHRWHLVKERSEQEAYEFLARYRTSYEWVIPKLRASGCTQVLRFNTDHESPDQIADRVLAALDSHPSIG